VLYGPIAEVRRKFAANAVIVEGHGDLGTLPDVTSVQRQNGRAVLQLKEGASPQQILRTLSHNDHFTVERFEIALPSLDDIFVQVAQEEDV